MNYSNANSQLREPAIPAYPTGFIGTLENKEYKGRPFLSGSIGIDKGPQEKKRWVSVSFWGDELINKAKKFSIGDKVTIFGDLSISEYVRKDGKKVAGLKIKAEDILLVKKKNTLEPPKTEPMPPVAPVSEAPTFY